MGPCFSLQPHTSARGSRNHMHKKSCNRGSSALKLDERSYVKNLISSPNPGGRRWHSSPLQIGCYSPGTEPDHIPYHLYLLVKEAVDIMKRSEWNENFNDLDRLKASSLIAGYDTIFAKDGPRYNMSGYTPLGDQVEHPFDVKTQVSTGSIVKLMSIVHSRKTPAPETFMEWSSPRILFYCKLCSCFGIDYQNLESASEDDVCLMNMGF
ncbi:hypothetical protein E3N88_39797 [Mikania micrantha]|uniref:Uncharacterized protein n=1 Tax=Mikania micrantha TaxID=192012 RepID=A0A5N6LKS5_9ASTR|nr:hypothetical protein E3N88_39797 [Mikania micrantha]